MGTRSSGMAIYLVGAEFIPRDPAKQGYFLNVVKTWIFGLLKEASK